MRKTMLTVAFFFQSFFRLASFSISGMNYRKGAMSMRRKRSDSWPQPVHSRSAGVPWAWHSTLRQHELFTLYLRRQTTAGAEADGQCCRPGLAIWRRRGGVCEGRSRGDPTGKGAGSGGG
ncbi:hypothetical protein PAHAL_4G061900 [Panicum hallii]|uniref:Secreted protein n=1 Tax=Panicum hallii TaxID=206008 RepID=A0A2T8JBY4_9POAL|nr:hypothetical protein PAHAL_4G061900 [Panicum hallii]